MNLRSQSSPKLKKTNPKLQLAAVKVKTGRYFDELWLKFLKVAEVEDYKMTRADETEIEMTFTVEEY